MIYVSPHLKGNYGTAMLALFVSLFSSFTVLAQAPLAIPDSSMNVEPEDVEANERELTAEEDPLAAKESDKKERESLWYAEPNTLRTYGSVRIHYRDTAAGAVWGDGNSRVGVEGHWQMFPKRWLFAGAEVGFNVLDSIDQLIDPSSASKEGRSDVFERLAYIGYDGPNLMAMYGKNWSTYYKVASFTDRFQATGGDASGAYNARTDGGATGTGRADKVLQTRWFIDFFPDSWNIKPFNLNLQVQHGEPIPAIENVYYGTAYGISAILNANNGNTLGIAYNNANVHDKSNPIISNAGIDGNAEALILGTRWYGDKWYLGLIGSRLENHETTDKNIYFDGYGWEFYGQYNLHGRWWMTGGYNSLHPDGDQQQAGQYKLDYGLIGLRYTFDEFRRMFYFNARIDDGRSTDGKPAGNIYTIGIRWDMEKTLKRSPLKHL